MYEVCNINDLEIIVQKLCSLELKQSAWIQREFSIIQMT